MKPKLDWIVVNQNNYPNTFDCLRCGESVATPMPCKFDTAINMMNGFMEAHKNCKEKVK